MCTCVCVFAGVVFPQENHEPKIDLSVSLFAPSKSRRFDFGGNEREENVATEKKR